MTTDTANWSGEGEFTQKLIDQLQHVAEIRSLRIEDAPASRSEADYNFISNEIFVEFTTTVRHEAAKKWGVIPITRDVPVRTMTVSALEAALTAVEEIGAPDYSDDGMLQYLHTERIIPPYQTKGYKIVELVRIYEVGATPRR